METTPGSPDSKVTSTFGVPLAIVIAGGFIALAIYFGGAKPGTTTPQAAVPSGAPQGAVPAQPVIGEIRAVSDQDHVRGPQNAKVTVIEYSDLECPFCKRFHPTMQQLVSEFPNDVRWVYRHFPLEQLHKQAPAESVATECAGEQGKFWELLDKIYAVTTSNDGLDLKQLPVYAKEVGVANIPQFEACLTSDKFKERIAADMADAQVAGGRGTPYSVVIGPDGTKQAISGAQPYASVKQMVEAMLK